MIGCYAVPNEIKQGCWKFDLRACYFLAYILPLLSPVAMLPWPSTQPVELFSQASLGDCVMKCSSPSQVPVCGPAMRPLPPPQTTTMSPSLVLWMDFSCQSLVPSVLRLTLTVSMCPAWYLPLTSPWSFISNCTPLGPMSLIVVLLFLALNSKRSSPFIFCV